ncbi:MAG TPA: glutaminyl-peptide cyclotransferase [Gemmatimonadaceae bacterium]
MRTLIRGRSLRVRTLGMAAALCLAACNGDADDSDANRPPALPPGMQPPQQTNADARPPAVPFDTTTPRVSPHVIRSWPHDTAAYTQGLATYLGRLLESTGRLAQSDVREVDAKTGAVRRRVALPATEFGEGITVVGNRLYQLTWRGGWGHVYDANTLTPIDSFAYAGEGWGLATDGRMLYMSDGTSRIRVLDPTGFHELRTIQVREADSTVWMLNELEWVRGELWANVYQTDFIARIEPTTGHVIGWINVGNLLTAAQRQDVAKRGGVANGIGFDAIRNRLFLTGKLWPRLFEVDVASIQRRHQSGSVER